MGKLVGILLALVSTFTNGSFSILSKFEPAKSSGVDPLIFNFYTCLGAGFSSLLIPLFGYQFEFTWLGFISGLLFCSSCAAAFVAIKNVGLGVGSGLWGGIAVVVSFLFGEFYDSPVSDLPLALFAIALLMVSMIGISHAGTMTHRYSYVELTQDLLENEESKNEPSRVLGFVMASISGVTGGLILSPKTFAPTNAQGLAYLPSFGIGTIILAPLITYLPYIIACKRCPKLFPGEAGPLGLCSGVIWNVGNVCATLAINQVGYSIAYPIMQCGLFVAGLWGIFLFGEIPGPYRNLYWISGAFMFSGVILLATSD